MESLTTPTVVAFAVYDCEKKKFSYSESMNALFNGSFDDRPLWQIIKEDVISANSTVSKIKSAVEMAEKESTYGNISMELNMKNKTGEYSRFKVEIMCTQPGKEIVITFHYLCRAEEHCFKEQRNDELTGLLRRRFFAQAVGNFINDIPDEDLNKYVLVYFDVQRFKAINDIFGMSEGDRLLRHIAEVIKNTVENKGFGCRIGSDRFAFLTRVDDGDTDSFAENFLKSISTYYLPFEITCNAGIYVLTDKSLTPGAMIDRAILAQVSVKGSYTVRYTYYTETLREDLISEQEISGMMRDALENRQFVVYFQPQYNHSTGMLVGAEALVRWRHPEKGIIPPGNFIPIFEKNGFITKLDLYVFENVCAFIRNSIDLGRPVVPISTNLTRYDIFSHGFIEKLEAIREKYDVPSKYIRVEITESAALGNSDFINEAVKKLHSYGFVVEMDDFGSGYSSLNILKDIDFDVIKLDMKFLQNGSETNNKGGTILSSVVRMVNWLSMPVIAEGVETAQQADFLRSVGCDYIQGYLYSKPLPCEQYEERLEKSFTGNLIPQTQIIKPLHTGDFWSYDSMETLIFNNFVGGAAVFEYHDNTVEILRANKKFIMEIGMNVSEKGLMETNWRDVMDEANDKIYRDMLQRAIETNEEQECETWCNFKSKSCGEDRICLRNTVRLIGRNKNTYLFYCMIRNITKERKHYDNIIDNERRFKAASEQVNIYYWEYIVATKEMHPCYRCMRDFGLPALLTNYPDSAIEMGVFPPEVADMYRDWHRQIAEGVPSLEAVMPLTVGKIPFHVRYTTEFDESGKPVKAYGSATMVVD